MDTDTEMIKTRIDIWSEELKALHSIENWGTSLFLTAIALLTKQIIDWSIPVPPATSPSYVPQWQIFTLPAVLGFAAFVFLRVVNYRIRKTRRQQFALVEPTRGRGPESWGLVGWSMALMPMLFGLAASYYFSLTNPSLLCPLNWLLVVSVIASIVAICLYVKQSREE